jgi:hypothetical protein
MTHITIEREVLERALKALWKTANPESEKAILDIQQALAPAQPAQRKPLISKDFEEFVKAELGDTAVSDNGRYISPKIQNYWKIWEHCNTAPPAAQRTEPLTIDGHTSDGYHTFNELYEFRKVYNAALFNEWAAVGKCSVHKSWRHHDGELCFGGGWFIVVAVLPAGLISNHYKAKDWDLFAIPEAESVLFEYDGHTGADVIERLKAFTPAQPAQRKPLTDEEIDDFGYPHFVTNQLPSLRFVVRHLEAKLKQKNGL